jgi:hypothetical protein
MLKKIKEYLPNLFNSQIPKKQSSDKSFQYVTEYWFEDKIDYIFEKDKDYINSIFNPLEEICINNGFQKIVTKREIEIKEKDLEGYMRYGEYLKIEDSNNPHPIYIKNSIWAMGGIKTTRIFFPEGMENKKFLSVIQELYSTKPKFILKDAVNKGFVIEFFGKRKTITNEMINNAWKKTWEKYRNSF